MEEKKEEVKEIKSKIIGGLCWPEDGNPAFLVLLSERKQKKEESLDPQIEYVEIIKEIEGQTVDTLVSQIKDSIDVIYFPTAAKYRTFIIDINTWRKENNISVRFSSSVNSSFESGILKIKDFIKLGKLKFPVESKVREQLKIFSKLSFKSQSDFYAVVALSCAISAIRKREEGSKEEERSIKNWY